MGKYTDEMQEWAELFTNTVAQMAQRHEHAITHAGLCNSIILGLMKGKNKKTFYVSDELIKQFKADKKGFFITCHGTDERGRVKYVVEVKETTEA